ncbi:hypothetical protein EON67_09415, partial [archaeon]
MWCRRAAHELYMAATTAVHYTLLVPHRTAADAPPPVTGVFSVAHEAVAGGGSTTLAALRAAFPFQGLFHFRVRTLLAQLDGTLRCACLGRGWVCADPARSALPPHARIVHENVAHARARARTHSCVCARAASVHATSSAYVWLDLVNDAELLPRADDAGVLHVRVLPLFELRLGDANDATYAWSPQQYEAWKASRA